MPKKPLDPLIKVRKAMCLDIAEEIVSDCVARKQFLDEDRIAAIIDMRLPHTYDEYAVIVKVFDDEEKEAEKPKGPGLGERMREEMGYGPEMSLKETIEGILDFIAMAKKKYPKLARKSNGG